MKPAAAAIVLLGLLLLLGLLQGAPEPDAARIDAYIARQARQEKGEEYKEARKMMTGDLDGDGTPETVVLYTIEGQSGGNNYVQYLAVFAHVRAGLEPVARARVGGKNVASVELIGVRDSTIHLTALRYGPDDPSCCPSLKATVRYRLLGRALREVKE